MKRHAIKSNPLEQKDLQEYNLIAYTNGACRRRKEGSIGSTAYILYDRDHNVIALEVERVEEDEVDIKPSLKWQLKEECNERADHRRS